MALPREPLRRRMAGLRRSAQPIMRLRPLRAHAVNGRRGRPPATAFARHAVKLPAHVRGAAISAQYRGYMPSTLIVRQYFHRESRYCHTQPKRSWLISGTRRRHLIKEERR